MRRLSSSLALLLSLVGPCLSAAAQGAPPGYWQLTLGPYGRDVLALAQTDDGHQVSGTSDGVFIRLGTGDTWHRSEFARRNVPEVVAEGSTLYAGVLGGAPGAAAQVYRSADGGATWASFPANLPGTQIYALGAVPGGRAFASTENGLYSAGPTDPTWTLEQVPTNVVVVGLPLGPDGAALYACGSPARVLRRTPTGAWEDLSAGIGITAPIYGCHVAADGAVYISRPARVRRRLPSGAWEEVSTGLGTAPSTGQLGAFAEAPDGTLFTAGYRPFRLAPGATAWEILPEIRPFGELQAEATTEALLVGSNGALVAGTKVDRIARPIPVPPPGPYGRYPHYYGGAYEYDDTAGEWRSAGSGLALERIRAVVRGPGGVAWAATDGGGVHRIDPALDIEPRRFEAWNRDDGPLALANVPFLASAASDALVAGTDSLTTGRVWRRTGLSVWEDVTGGLPAGPLTAVLVTDAGALFAAVEGAGLHRLPTGSSAWQAASPWSDGRDVGAISVVGPLVAVGDGTGGVALTSDGGASWTTAAQLPASATTFAAGRPGEILAATRGAGVRVSTDSGASWSALGSGIETDTVTAVVVTPSEMYGGVSGRGVYRLGVGEETWRAANTWLTDFDVIGLAATPQGFLYAATPRTVLQGAGYLPVAGESSPDTGSIDVTAYPNPFSDCITVSMTLERAGAVDFDMFDVLGRRVTTGSTGSRPIGPTSLRLGCNVAGGLRPGLYLVRLDWSGGTTAISITKR